MASFTLESCGKCHRPIHIPSPVGTIKGGDGMPHLAHKKCADQVHAEANPVVVTSREELLGGLLDKGQIADLPLPPKVVSHPAPEVQTIHLEAPIDEYEIEIIATPAEEPQPSTPVREQQAARRKPAAKKAPAKKVEVEAEAE